MKRVIPIALSLMVAACIPAPVPEIEWVDAPFNQVNEATDSRGRIKKGDVVRVIIKEGQKQDVFDVHDVDDKTFLGVSLLDHRTYRVSYAALERMEVRRWTVGMTVLTPGRVK